MTTFLSTITLIIALGFAIETTVSLEVETCSDPIGQLPPPIN